MTMIHAWFSMEAAARTGIAVYRKPSGDEVNVTRTSDDIADKVGRRGDEAYLGEVIRAEDGGCVHPTRKPTTNN